MQPQSNPMRLREIVTVAIRILAINLGLESVTFLLKALAGYHADPSSRNAFPIFAIAAVITCLLWLSSGSLARFITRGQDSTLDCGGLTLADLYAFAFLIAGLYFAVDSLGPSLTWLHYSLRQSSAAAPISLEQKANFYTLFKYLLRLLLGLALIFNGRKFTAKLIKRQNEGT
jgi:hypothetical protein